MGLVCYEDMRAQYDHGVLGLGRTEDSTPHNVDVLIDVFKRGVSWDSHS